MAVVKMSVEWDNREVEVTVPSRFEGVAAGPTDAELELLLDEALRRTRAALGLPAVKA